MSKPDDGLGFVILIVCIALAAAGGVVGLGCGEWIGVARVQREAVKAGHAEYVVGECGESVWQWKVDR